MKGFEFKKPSFQMLMDILPIIGIALIANFLSNHYYHRYDLTEKKIFTLSPKTLEIFNKIDGVVEVKVYVSEDLPDTVRFEDGRKFYLRGLERQIRDKFDEFRASSKGKLKVTFVKEDALEEGQKAGLESFSTQEVEKKKQKVEFKTAVVGAVFFYKDRKVVIPLLLNASYLEFEIARALLDVTRPPRGQRYIGILCGHGEFCPFMSKVIKVNPDIAQLLGQKNQITQFILNSLREMTRQLDQLNMGLNQYFEKKGYKLKRVNAGYEVPDDVDLLLILSPEEKFQPRDLYAIDQYLMRGGSVALLFTNFDVDMAEYKAKLYDLGLSDFLRHYGVQTTNDMVLDKKHHGTILVGQQKPEEYPFVPIVMEYEDQHPLVRNLPELMLPFPTVVAPTKEVMEDKSIRATILLKTSEDSLTITPKATEGSDLKEINISPYEYDKTIAGIEPQGSRPIGVVVSGTFKSYFDGKEIPAPLPPEKDPEEEMGLKKPSEKEDEKKEEKPFVSAGAGKFLVIGSNLGIYGFGADKFFKEVDMMKIYNPQMSGDALSKVMEARKQIEATWQKLVQLSQYLQGNLAFLDNIFDWGLQNEALNEIRGKQFTAKSLEYVDESTQLMLKIIVWLVIPVLFIGFGVGRWAWRRSKFATVKA